MAETLPTQHVQGPSANPVPLQAPGSAGSRTVQSWYRLGESERPAPPMPTQVGRYDILRELGRGGMGIVYLAYDPLLKRHVAIKMLPGSGQAPPEVLARFRGEAEAIARLRHAHIVQIYEVGEAEGCPYLVLEYIEGGTLREHCAGKPQEPRPAARLVQTLTQAMEYAHAQGVIHRDLKPANVLMTPHSAGTPAHAADPGGAGLTSTMVRRDWLRSAEPKISDFGLAKHAPTTGPESALDTPTRTGEVVGTPNYMAPEQARAARDEIGPRTDIYALGAILYELLTGRPPFDAPTPMEILLQLLHQDPLAPRRLQARVPRDLETICLKCLEKEPRKRYESMQGLAEDLRRFLAGEPIIARPASRWELLAKWAKRRPTVAALTGSLVLVTLLGLGLVGWQWREAVVARAHAEQHATLERQARTLAEQQRREAARREARLALQRGEPTASAGDVAAALSSFEAGLEQAKLAGDAPLIEALRANIVAWQKAVPVQRFRLAHPGVRALAYTHEGTRLVSAGQGKVYFWDLKTGARVPPEIDVFFAVQQAPTRLFAVAWHEPTALLAVGSADYYARIWSLTGPAVPRPRFLTHAGADVWSVAFSPDGQYLFTGGSDGIARQWHATTGNLVSDGFRHSDREPIAALRQIHAVAVSPDGRWLATTGRDHMARLWDIATGELVCPPLPHSDWVLCASFTPDGKQVITGGRDRLARVWDLPGGQPRGVPMRMNEWITALAVSPTGAWLLTGSESGHARLWDLTSQAAVGPVTRLTDTVQSVVFRSDGQQFALGGGEEIHSYDFPGLPDAAPPERVGDSLLTLDYGAEDTAIWTVSDTRVRLLQPNSMVHRHLPRVHDRRISDAAVSADGRLAVTAAWDGKVQVYDLTTAKVLGKPMEVWRDFNTKICLAADGSRLLTYESHQPPRIWEPRTGKRLGVYAKRPESGTLDIMVSRPDGQCFASGGRNRKVYLRHWDTGEPDGPPLELPETLSALAWSRDGARLLAGCRDGSAICWDVATRSPVGPPLRCDGAVVSVAISPDGRLLATGSADGVVRFWHAATGLPIGPAMVHADSVAAVRFSRSGHQLASGDRSGWVRIWNVPPSPSVSD